MPIDKLRKILAAAGAPLTLDQIMEQLPDGADRAAVGALCRERKAAGELASSIEGGKVAYALAPPAADEAAAPEPAPAAPAAPAANTVHRVTFGRRASDVPGAKSASLTDQIRELLRGANAPLTVAQVAAALPDANPASVQSLLQQRKKAGEFVATPAGGTAHGYSIGPGAAVAVAVAGPPAVEPPAAPPPVATPPPAPPAEPPPAPGTAISVYDEAYTAAEKALDLYVASVLPDANVYFGLKASVAAARAARDASREGRREH